MTHVYIFDISKQRLLSVLDVLFVVFRIVDSAR